jgi:hypothetical protein
VKLSVLAIVVLYFSVATIFWWGCAYAWMSH